MIKLTSESAVGYSLVLPAATTVCMVSGEPDLSQIRRQLVTGKPLPDGWTEGWTSLIQGKGMESMLDPIRQTRVVPLICALKSVWNGTKYRTGGLILHCQRGFPTCPATQHGGHPDCPLCPKHRRP